MPICSATTRAMYARLAPSFCAPTANPRNITTTGTHAIVEPALHVDGFAHGGGHGGVGDDRFAERGVGRREHCREKRQLQQIKLRAYMKYELVRTYVDTVVEVQIRRNTGEIA